MRGTASVSAREGRLFIESFSIGERGRVANGWMRDAPEAVPDEELGALIRSAIRESREGASWPDFSKGPTPWEKEFLKLVGVKSYGQFMRGARQVLVSMNDPRPGCEIYPTRNQRRAFVPIIELIVQLAPDVSDEVLGGRAREALNASE